MLLKSPETRKEYYTKVTNLELVGVRANVCRLTRSALLDLTTVPRLEVRDITNRPLLEPSDFCDRTNLNSVYLDTIVEYIFPKLAQQCGRL